MLLGRRNIHILDGKQGFTARHRAPFQSSIMPKAIKLISPISTYLTQVSNNENLLNRQTWKEHPVPHTPAKPCNWRRRQDVFVTSPFRGMLVDFGERRMF